MYNLIMNKISIKNIVFHLKRQQRINSVMLKSIWIIFFVWLITGCVPKMQTTSPFVSGIVVDTKSNKGLFNVLIASNRSDKDGSFLIKGEQEIGIGTPMGGIWQLPTLLFVVKKDGYYPLYCQCQSLNIQKGCEDVVIKLVSLKETISPNHKYSVGEGLSCRLYS